MRIRRLAFVHFLTALFCVAPVRFRATAQEPKAGVQPAAKEIPAEGQKLDIYGDPLPLGAVARFGSLRLKHSQPGVHSVCYSPDGKMIASGGEDCTVRLWEAETGKSLHVFKGHKHPVTSVAISPKGDLLASGDKRGGFILWRLKDYSLRYEDHKLGHMDVTLAFSPDGTTLAAVEQRFALILIPTDTPSRAKRIGIPRFGPFWATWSPDGKTVALLGSGSNKRRDLLVIESQSGAVLAEPDSKPRAPFPNYSGIVFSPNGDTLFTIDSFFPERRDYGGGLTAWKWANSKLEEIGRVAPDKNWDSACSGLSHHPREPLVAYYSYNLLIVQNWKTQEVVGIAHTDRGSATAFSPDGRHLATAGAMLRVWTVPNLKPVFEYHPDILPVSFSKDSRQAAAGSVLWDLKTLQPLHAAENAYAQMGHTHYATHTKYFPAPNGVRIVGGEKIFSYSFNRQHLHFEDVNNEKRLVDYDALKDFKSSDAFGIDYVDFSDDMSRAVLRARDAEKGTLFTAMRVSDGAVLQRFNLLNNPKNSGSHLMLSPDGRTLATMLGGEGYNLHIFDTATGTSKQLTNFDDGRLLINEGVIFSKKGDHIALYLPLTRSYFVYSIPQGKEVVKVLRPKLDLRNPFASEIRLGVPAFSEDDRLFAVAEGEFTSEQASSFQTTISVWDLKKCERLWTQEWGAELPRNISFAGDQLVVAGERFAVWDGASGRLVMDISLQEGDKPLFYVSGVQSPDRRWALAGRSDGITELIDIDSGKLVGELTAHGVTIESYHFTPDSKQLVTTFEDRTALLWDLPAIEQRAP